MFVYANAADVLPPDLLTEVRKHWNGYLYVPPEKKQKTLTDLVKTILITIQSGCPARDVAVSYGISLWSVYRLARRLGPLNPYAANARNSHRNRHKAPTANAGTSDGTFRQSPGKRAESPLKRGRNRTPRK